MYKWLYFAGIGVTIMLTVILIAIDVSYNRTDMWLERAKDAGNPAQVAEFLKEYQTSLEDRDLVNGKYYSIWKYPATDMNTYIRVIEGLTARATDLSKQKSDDTSYQMGLINLEKDLGDIDARAFSVWVAGGGFILSWAVGLFGVWVVFGWIPCV